MTRYSYGDPTNAPDSPTRVQDVLGRHVDYAYDTLGLTKLTTDQRGHKTSFTIIPSGPLKGLVSSVTDSSVTEWWQTDLLDHVANQTVRLGYDANGNAKADTSAIGTITSYGVDTLGRLINVYFPDSARTGYVYDPMNRLTQVIQYTTAQAHPGGVAPLAGCVATAATCTISAYSTDNVAATLTILYFYGPVGVDSVRDPLGVMRGYRYDAAGRQVQEIDDYGVAKTATYNAATGLLDAVTTRGGNLIQHYYDRMGRDSAVIYPAINLNRVAGDTILYRYDLLSRLIADSNRTGKITRSYFADGTLRTKVTLPGGWDSLSYRYDSVGARIGLSQTHNPGWATFTDSVRYRYKASGDLDSLWVTSGNETAPYVTPRVFSFTWDELGRRRHVTYPAVTRSLVVDFHYDRAGLLRQVVPRCQGISAGTDFFRFTLTEAQADPLGRVTRRDTECNGTPTLPGTLCEGALTNTTTR